MDTLRYPALARVLAASKAPQTLKAWRWVNDILPSQASPHWKGDGIYGPGTYLRPSDESPIEGYLKLRSPWRGSKSLLPVYRDDPEYAVRWKLFTEYQISFQNLARLNDQNTEHLWSDEFIGLEGNPLRVGEFNCEEVEALLKKGGFDGALVTGKDVDGGNQVFIPAGKKPPATVLQFHLILRDPELAARIGKKIQQALRKCGNGMLLSFSPVQAPEVEALLSL
jgi:hypothetical protein